MDMDTTTMTSFQIYLDLTFNNCRGITFNNCIGLTFKDCIFTNSQGTLTIYTYVLKCMSHNENCDKCIPLTCLFYDYSKYYVNYEISAFT